MGRLTREQEMWAAHLRAGRADLPILLPPGEQQQCEAGGGLGESEPWRLEAWPFWAVVVSLLALMGLALWAVAIL
jgi:hypothetical protein